MSIFTVLEKFLKKNTVTVDSVVTTSKATIKNEQIAKPRKATKKQFDIYKFVSKYSDDVKPYELVIHYEEGKQIVTDGRFMVVNECEYSDDKENKNFSFLKVSKTECEHDFKYPQWKKIIPDLADYEKCFINIEDFATIRKMTTSKSDRKLQDMYVGFADNENAIYTNMKMIDKMQYFISTSKNCELYSSKKPYSPLYLKADDRFMLIMSNRECSDSSLFVKVENGKIMDSETLNNKNVA